MERVKRTEMERISIVCLIVDKYIVYPFYFLDIVIIV